MIQTVYRNDFHQAFKDYRRENNFSRTGLDALFKYYEELEASTEQEIELDVIAICCEWNEYESLEAAWEAYSDEEYPGDEDALEWFQHRTTILEHDEGVVVQEF